MTMAAGCRLRLLGGLCGGGGRAQGVGGTAAGGICGPVRAGLGAARADRYLRPNWTPPAPCAHAAIVVGALGRVGTRASDC